MKSILESASTLYQVVKQCVSPFTNILMAAVNWLSACRIIINLLIELVNIVYILLILLGGTVVNMIVAIRKFISDLFAFFLRKANVSDIANLFFVLMNTVFRGIIKEILSALANILLGGLWSSIYKIADKIVSFFQNFYNCFSSISAFGKCILKVIHLKRNTKTVFALMFRCLTCNATNGMS